MTGRAFIVDAVRTPVGRHGGALAHVRPDDLAAAVIGTLVSRTPLLDPADVDDVCYGAANGAGEDNRNVARMGTLLAGLPVSVTGSTVNRLCGSGMEAVMSASRAIDAGDDDICIAGGGESMSRAPWVLTKPDRPHPRGHTTAFDTTLGWRMVNPTMRDEWTVALGEGAEILADRYGITRDEQDRFALRSHQRAAAAWTAGAFEAEIVHLDGVALEQDETIRPDATLESLSRLRPAFRTDGSVTAGNSSPLNDGAAALLLASEEGLGRLGREPLARVAGRATAGVSPELFGVAPVDAANEALRRAGISWDDLVAVELNEAFAAQALACLAGWPELDAEIVNVHGGAIAIGHPLGCSGARIVGHLAHHLAASGGYGLAVICIGVGQGLAVVLESANTRMGKTR